MRAPTVRSVRLTARFGIGLLGLTFLTSIAWLFLWAVLVPTVRGWSPVVITSGSMEPNLRAGDIVLFAPPTDALLPGNVVVFDNPSGSGRITHRVVAVDPSGAYVTRGDANQRVDSTPVAPESIRGVGRVVVPILARPVVWFSTGQWLWVVLTAASILAAGWTSTWTVSGRAARDEPEVTEAVGPELGPALSPLPTPLSTANQERFVPRRGLAALAAMIAGIFMLSAMTNSVSAFSTTSQNSGSSFSTASSFGITFYLHNNPTPPVGDTSSQQDLPLDATTPTATTLHNYDTDRDAFAGILLAKGNGLSESDSNKYQRWLHAPGSDLTLSGDAKLTVWSAMKDFQSGKQGSIVVGLYDCNGGGNSCTLIADGNLSMGSWPSSWQAVEVDLGSVNHVMAASRTLVVHLAAVDPSDDLWFAYDTTTYQSQLTID